MTSQNPETETCPCQFTPKERELERDARYEFLRQYGDELPKDVIENMVSDEF